jgi:hypothetical protein
MELKPETQTKLQHGKERLAAEFNTVPEQAIAKAVDGAAGRLLRLARFDDYIPMLAQRYVRDSLLDHLAA